MGGHKGRAGSETAVDFPCRSPPFFDIEKMQREQAGRGIEGASRRILDVALLQLNAGVERPKRALGLLQHLRGRIDAHECPARLGFCQGSQLQTSAGAQHQHVCVWRSVLRQQNRRHAVQVGKTGHEARRPFGVARHRLGIGEGGHEWLGS